uniref:Tudor domain-containing protein n=1 Tax=Timema shepardi TaxID=629360 RepID=A0A7R9G081_TIMSH|nr:unnamed protein product [Timema shepardi]
MEHPKALIREGGDRVLSRLEWNTAMLYRVVPKQLDDYSPEKQTRCPRRRIKASSPDDEWSMSVVWLGASCLLTGPSSTGWLQENPPLLPGPTLRAFLHDSCVGLECVHCYMTVKVELSRTEHRGNNKPRAGLMAPVEQEVMRHFSHLHGLLQLQEAQMLARLEEARNLKLDGLRTISGQLQANLEQVRESLEEARLASDQTNLATLDVRGVTARLLALQDIPCHLMSENTGLEDTVRGENRPGGYRQVRAQAWRIPSGESTGLEDTVRGENRPGGYRQVRAQAWRILSGERTGLSETEDGADFHVDEEFLTSLEHHCELKVQTSITHSLLSTSDLPPDTVVEPIHDLAIEASCPTFSTTSQASSLVSGVSEEVERPAFSFSTSPVLSTDAQILARSIDPVSKSEALKTNKLIKGTTEVVVVTHVKSPGDFYVQRTSDRAHLSASESQFNKLGSMGKPPSHIMKNGVYLVQYLADMKWYRGRVQSIIKKSDKDESALILYIDFGNTEVVPKSRLRCIPLHIVSSPGMALRCSLFGLKPSNDDWTLESKTMFAQMVDGSEVLMVIMSYDNGGVYEVDLCSLPGSRGDVPVSLRDALLFLDLAHMSRDIPTTARSTNTNKDFFKKDGMKHGDIFDVYVTHIETPASFYVQQLANALVVLSLTAEDGEIEVRISAGDGLLYLNQMMQELDEELKRNGNLGLIYSPKLNMPCAAMYSDNTWYRAKVTGLPGKKMVQVLYVDYGNTEAVSWNKLRKLHDKYFKLPSQAIHCSLKDVMPLANTNNQWTSAARAFLIRETNSKLMRLFVDAVAGTTLKVTLYDSRPTVDICLNALLVRQGLAKSCGVSSSLVEFHKGTVDYKPEKPSAVPRAQPRSSVKKSKAKPRFVAKPAPSTEETETETENEGRSKGPLKLEVKILSSTSPSQLYVSLDCQEELISSMMQELQEFYCRSNPPEGKVWEAGNSCVAYVSKDRMWYRAIVQEMLPDDRAKVFLKDIAVEVVVDASYLRELEDNFRQVRDGAVKCHLAGIKAAGDKGKWPGLANEFLTEMIAKYDSFSIAKSSSWLKIQKSTVQSLVIPEFFCEALGLEQGKTLAGEIEDSSLPVELWVKEVIPGGPLNPTLELDITLNNRLVEQGLAIPVRPTAQLLKDLTNQNISEKCTVSHWLLEASQSPKKTKSSSHRKSPKKRTPASSEVLIEAEKEVLLNNTIDTKLSTDEENGGRVSSGRVGDNAGSLTQDQTVKSPVKIVDVTKAGNIGGSDKPSQECEVPAVSTISSVPDKQNKESLVPLPENVSDSVSEPLLPKDSVLEPSLSEANITESSSPGVGHLETSKSSKALGAGERSTSPIKQGSDPVDPRRAEERILNKPTLTVGGKHSYKRHLSESMIAHGSASDSGEDEKGDDGDDEEGESDYKSGEAEEVTDDSEVIDEVGDVIDAEKENESSLLEDLHSGIDWLPADELKEENFYAVPSYVDNDCSVYLHPHETEETLRIIQNMLELRFKNSKPKPHDFYWSAGLPCIAQYHSDNKWYRAKVLEVNDNDRSIKVRFVDYGNEEICRATELRKDLCMSHIPIQSTKCFVQCIVPLTEDGNWPVDTLDTVHMNCVEKMCYVTVKKSLEGGYILTSLIGPNKINIFQLMVESALCEYRPVELATDALAIGEPYQEDNDDDDDDDDVILEEMKDLQPQKLVDWFELCTAEETEQHESEKRMAKSPVSKKRLEYVIFEPPELDSFSGDVTAIMAPNEVVIHLHKTETPELREMLEVFELLTVELQQEASDQPLLKDPYIGQPCCACYAEDNLWYRAVVLLVDGEQVKVSYIDYGNTEVLPIGSLHELKPSWVELPIQGLQCKLWGVAIPEDYDKDVLYPRLIQCLFQPPLTINVKLANALFVLSSTTEDGEIEVRISCYSTKPSLLKRLTVKSDEQTVHRFSPKNLPGKDQSRLMYGK